MRRRKSDELKPAVWLVSITIVALFFAVCVMQHNTIIDLKREKEAHDWRNFTCRTLLDDPQTRAILDIKWQREDRKFRCDHAQMIKDREGAK